MFMSDLFFRDDSLCHDPWEYNGIQLEPGRTVESIPDRLKYDVEPLTGNLPLLFCSYCCFIFVFCVTSTWEVPQCVEDQHGEGTEGDRGGAPVEGNAKSVSAVDVPRT